MANQDAIRLTNRTARALRKSAKRQRTLHTVFAVVVTLVLAVTSVLLGLGNLAFVPLCVGAAVLLDALILMAGKARYLSLTGQAICTEAAARQIQGEAAESSRKRQALRDLAALKADMEQAQHAASMEEDDDLSAAQETPADDEEDADDPDLRPAAQARASRADAPAHRRRRQAGFQVIHHDERAK